MKVKLDENVTHEAVAIFADAGHDVHTVVDEELVGRPDADIWVACLSERRMLVTFDLGFGDIRAYPPAIHAGSCSSDWLISSRPSWPMFSVDSWQTTTWMP